ncbi:MAG TPA: alpha/beta hydrolase [Phycisphaerae bacterium]|nr:alpha/beta hydrolase [Phycisphaerae bacterium]
MRKRPVKIVGLLMVLAAAAPAAASERKGIEFEVTFDKAVRDEPFTGRVLFFLCDEQRPGPPRARWVFSSDPAFSVDVEDWQPETPLRVRDPRGAPCDLQDLPPGRYKIQAVMHTNVGMPHSGEAPGNLYSNYRRLWLDPAEGRVVKFRIDNKVPPDDRSPELNDAEVVEIRSDLLSRFHRREVLLHAVVWLPDEYDSKPDRRFPAIYVVPGFGGDHFQAIRLAAMLGRSEVPFVRIGLDPTLPYGHNVFADSDNNGPCGRALVEELIPYLEKHYRLITEPRARFVTGHSSGGWSSLWLQVSYPDVFGGTWSTSPDPVDFHDFLGMDLYDRETNFFFDAKGRPRPTMRDGDNIVLTCPGEIRMEDVIGPGGQFGAFDAVFGPRGADGRPRPICDHKTGKIDRRVVRAWQRYDIRDKVEREWFTLGPRLAGKITVIMGQDDSFYLEGAARLLKRALKNLGSDARIIMVPGKDHFSIMHTRQYRRMIKEMEARFLSSEPAQQGERRDALGGTSAAQEKAPAIQPVMAATGTHLRPAA